jgi:energy-coupling factor transport system permease protein
VSPLLSSQAFSYRRLASPLHAARAGVAATWALALSVAALLLFHPLVLLALVGAVIGAGYACGLGGTLMRSLRTAAIVSVPIVAINVLVSRQGLTVFARLGDLGPFGQGDLTLEALVYGAVIALKVTLLILITTLASLSVDSDQLLSGLRRVSFRSALTVSLSTRMIPLLAADARRFAEAQRTRPHPPRAARARVALLGAVVGGSLDRALDVAATLELRGYAQGATGRRGCARGCAAPVGGAPAAGVRAAPSRHDIAFACSALAIVALAVAGRLSDAASFDAYPLLQMPVGVETLVLCVALLAAALLPFCDRRGIQR